MWPTTTRNRGKSGTPGRANEIWEGLRPLPFFPFAAPPHPRPYDGPCFCRISAPSVPPGRAAWPAPPSRPGAIAPRRVPCGGLMAVLGTKRNAGGIAIGRLAPGDSPPGFGRRWPGGRGGWWCAAGPVAGRRGLRRPVAPPARKPGATAPRPSGQHQGAGPAGHCGPPAMRVKAVPPWRRGGFWGLPAAPGVAASPGPSPARPRLWSILGGAPQSPAARVGPAVRNGCVPWRRQAPVFSVAPGPQRGAGT